MKHKESSKTYQEFVRFLKKKRIATNIPGDHKNQKILIVKKISLQDVFPNKIREEFQSVLKESPLKLKTIE